MAAIATLFAAASCQEELSQPDLMAEGDLQAVTFSVAAPAGLQTKALGDGMQDLDLEVAVYAGSQNAAGTLEAGTLLTSITPQIVETESNKWTVTLSLVKDYHYDIVFWAQVADAPYTFSAKEKTVTATYETAANDEKRDAFYYLCENYNILSDVDTKIFLTRPFAQVNLGAADYTALTALGINDLFSAVAATKVPNVLNLLDGTVSGEADVKFVLAAAPVNESAIIVDNKTYTLVGMNYILAAAEGATADMTLKFQYNGKTTPFEIEVPAVPFKRNWRTNIYGNFFTGDVIYNVEIKPDFSGDENINSDLTLQSVFQQGGTYVLTHDEELAEALELSNGKEVTIDLNGFDITALNGVDAFYVTDGTLTITNSNEKAVGTVKTQDMTAGYAVFVDGENAKAIIEGGNFVIGVDDLASNPENQASNSAVYTKNGATAEIKGGTFSVETEQKIDVVNKTRFLINENDNNRGTITITGGTYVDFDPADNLAEGEGTNFLADGHKTVSAEDAGQTVYTVVEMTPLEKAFAYGTEDGTYTLTEPVTLTEALVLSNGKSLTIDLAGFNITAEGGSDAFYVTDGTLTIRNSNETEVGIVKTQDKTAGYAVFVDGENAKAIIEGGNFVVGVDDLASYPENEASNSAVYTKNGATAEIKGGTFSVETEQTFNDVVNKTRFLINEHDSNRGTITITGGTYVDFNPADNLAEGEGTNFLADGYESVDNGDGSWIVSEMTVAKVTAIKDVVPGESEYTVEGVVVAVGVDGYVVADEDPIFVYAKNHGRKLNEKVQLTGVVSKNYDNNVMQFSSPAVTVLEEDAAYTYSPRSVDGAAIDAAVASGTATCEEVTFTGTLSVSGTYVNITVDGATKQGSLKYITASDYSSLASKKVVVKGYVTSTYNYYSVLPYSVELMPADWALRGIGGDWNTDYPMYEDGDWYVASDLEITEFKFKKVGEENWQGKGSVDANYPTKLGGDGNITVNNASGKYDIYLHKTLKFFAVTSVGQAPVVNWGIIGNWEGTPAWTEQMMTLKSGQYVLENVDIPANFVFKVRANGTWDNGIQYGSSGAAIAESGTDYALAWDSSDISSSLEAGTYSIYVASDLSTIRFVKAGTAPLMASLTFDETAKRTSFSTSEQVWEENGITVTNSKGSSTSNVGDYANPARFYKSSSLTVTCANNIESIAFTCNTASYATALKNSITGEVSVEDKVVTVKLATPAIEYNIPSLTGGQVRMDSVTVYFE